MSAPNDAVAELQIGFAAALHDAALLPALMERLARGDSASVETTLNDRVGLYRGNLHAHRRAALANAYPVLLSLVGDDYFDQLSRAYGLAYPSQSGDLNLFGEQLATFIGEYEADPQFAYFADMARLEWALHVAYYASDVAPFTADAWAEVGDPLLDSRIAIHPACRAVASKFAIAGIWLAHEPGGVFPSVIEASSYALVVRPGWKARVIGQSEAAHHAFLALQAGQTLNDALDVAFAIDEAFDFATQWRVWVDACAVVGTAGTSTVTTPT